MVGYHVQLGELPCSDLSPHTRGPMWGGTQLTAPRPRRESTLQDAQPIRLGLPDPHDAPLLDVAMAASPLVLVTGNLRHFPAQPVTAPPLSG